MNISRHNSYNYFIFIISLPKVALTYLDMTRMILRSEIMFFYLINECLNIKMFGLKLNKCERFSKIKYLSWESVKAQIGLVLCSAYNKHISPSVI